MGMFDTIKCEYELPLPDLNEEEQQDFKDVVWDEIDFQSTSFNSGMDVYEITSDGQIYMRKLSREILEDESSPMGVVFNTVEEGIEKVDYSGEIEFYHLHTGDKKDYWLEFKVLFWKGELKEIELLEFKGESNKERKKTQEHFEKEIKKAELKRKRWWFPFYKIYRAILSFVLGSMKRILEWFIILLIKIERWLP
jgi:hypothetical protein